MLYIGSFGRVSVNLLFEPRDLLVGVYWNTQWEGPRHILVLYVCLIPCVPVRLDIRISS